MKKNSDDRRNNVDRIQNNIDHTLANIEAAEEMMSSTDNSQQKQDLKAKNRRRNEALDSMRHEIQDEARDKKKDNQK